MLDFWNVNLWVYYKLKKKLISKQTWFFVEFELDFYCLCSLQKSISKSNWFFSFLNLIFWNWKKIEWHSIFQKSSGDRQGECAMERRTLFSPKNKFGGLFYISLQFSNFQLLNINTEVEFVLISSTMAIWVVEFSNGGYKIGKVFA